MKRDVIVACDFSGATEVFGFLDLFEGRRKPFVKIGMELFYAEGPAIVREIKRRGHYIFLDLKLHDIPNTVRKSMKVLSGLDVDMVNVHAAGTVEMMRAALEGITRPDGSRPLLIAVTQLTSTSEERMQRELLIGASMEDTIKQYALNAREAGLDGVVCSPREAGLVKQACGTSFLTVTPGIRFADGGSCPATSALASAPDGGSHPATSILAAVPLRLSNAGQLPPSGSVSDDQVRITTPAQARELGSDYIVVGRPITAADDPVAAYDRCIEEFAV